MRWSSDYGDELPGPIKKSDIPKQKSKKKSSHTKIVLALSFEWQEKGKKRLKWCKSKKDQCFIKGTDHL